MIVSIGTDLIAIQRIEHLLHARGERFVERVFTRAERTYCEAQARPGESFAARFAAKEAVMKCLGTGWADGVGFLDIEVTRAASGEVGVRLSGMAGTRATQRGISRVLLSLSHTVEHALAFAVGSAD